MRKPTTFEIILIELLLKKSSILINEDWKNNLLVVEMNDGGMGSLLLYPKGKMIEYRFFGEQIADYQFKDSDGIDVIVSLNIDTNGDLFELDLWKTNFSRLL